MPRTDLATAVSHIIEGVRFEEAQEHHSPFFFVVGAGISAPPIPLAKDIQAECMALARQLKRADPPTSTKPIDVYSHWFERARPHARQRQKYLRDMIQTNPVSAANLRLAHLLLGRSVTNLVVTPNFDDYLSQALTLFGEPHISCDHPLTVDRIDPGDRVEIQIVHVHGTYWFYDCCNLKGEIQRRADDSDSTSLTMATLLDNILARRSPIVIGYSGWEHDVIMTSIKRRIQFGTALPYNVYWFRYSEEDPVKLPDWLTEHPAVHIVSPGPRTPTEPPTELTEESFGDAGERLAADEITRERRNELTLPAHKILDEFVRALDIPSPALTDGPLGFLAGQLRKRVHDPARPDTSDVYHIRSVVERIERAREYSRNQFSKADSELEAVRDAHRRSRYRDALRIAATDTSISDFDTGQLAELIGLVFDASLELNDNSDDEIRGYELTVQLADRALEREFAEHDALLATQARALHSAIIAHTTAYQDTQALDACANVEMRFGKSNDPDVIEILARVLTVKGEILLRTDDPQSARATWDEVIKMEDLAPAKLRIIMATAELDKALSFEMPSQSEQALPLYASALARVGDPTTPEEKYVAIWALWGQALDYDALGRSKDAIASIDRAVELFGAETDIDLRTRVAASLLQKGAIMAAAKNHADAVEVYDDLVARFGDDSDIGIQTYVARALVDKGVRLGALKNNAGAIQTYDEVLKRFGGTEELLLQRRVAIAMFNKGNRLSAIGDRASARTTYQDMISQFGTSEDPTIVAQVAKAKARLATLGAKAK